MDVKTEQLVALFAVGLMLGVMISYMLNPPPMKIVHVYQTVKPEELEDEAHDH